MHNNLEEILQQKFGLEKFREGQKEIIESVLQKKDTLVFMPTGGGKSLTYQFPGFIMEGLVLVISPLISLMKDQVDKLNFLGLKAELINSTIDNYYKQIILNDISRDNSTIKFLYIAPERLNNEDFLRVISKIDISLVAIDEAHCISQWGHDFRPSYMKIRGFLENLKKNKNFPIVALTATATQKVREDIIERLGIQAPNVFTTGFERKNILIIVREISKREEKLEKLLEVIEKTPGNGIVYCASIKSCKEVYEYLLQKEITCGIYTGEMMAEDRERTQNIFMNGDLKVIIATNAFGMGIDKKDIRFVVHYNLPGSIENYYQEVGRAGRDGKNSFGVVLASFGDTKIQEFFIENSYPSKEDIVKFYEYLYKNFEIGEGKNTNILKTYLVMTLESGMKNDLKTGAIIRILEKYNILKRGVSSYDAPSNFRGKGITLILPKCSTNSIPVDWKHQELLKEESYFKLEQIKKLLFYPSCRKRFILEYFGDKQDLDKLGENCGTCDFCIERRKVGNEEVRDLVKLSVFSLVLETVRKFDERFGVQMIVKFLRGSQDKKLLDYHMDENENFGALSDFSSEAIQAIIEALIFREFLYKTDGQYPLLGITENGRIAIVRTFLLSNENNELQYFIRKKIGIKQIFKNQENKTKRQKNRNEKSEKVNTYMETLQIFEKEKDIKKIAEKREMTSMTIEQHIIKLYEQGDISIVDIMKYSSFDKLKKVKTIILENLFGDYSKLKPIKEELEKDGKKNISYFDIKIAISMMEKKDL